MCGIAGVIMGPGQVVSSDELCRISASIQHRGPNDEGYLGWSPGVPAWAGRNVNLAQGKLALIHRRLSILDLSPLGWQPMASADGRFHIVYNG